MFTKKLVAPKRELLLTPFKHADGDPMEIYLINTDDKRFILSDCGMTLMRLSYSTNITKGVIEDIFNIVNGYRLDFSREMGTITSEVNLENIDSYLYTFAMTVARVMALADTMEKKGY